MPRVASLVFAVLSMTATVTGDISLISALYPRSDVINNPSSPFLCFVPHRETHDRRGGGVSRIARLATCRIMRHEKHSQRF